MEEAWREVDIDGKDIKTSDKAGRVVGDMAGHPCVGSRIVAGSDTP